MNAFSNKWHLSVSDSTTCAMIRIVGMSDYIKDAWIWGMSDYIKDAWI